MPITLTDDEASEIRDALRSNASDRERNNAAHLINTAIKKREDAIRRSDFETFWYVASPEEAEKIILEGFPGTWGNVGYGVYVYDCLAVASKHSYKGGWDGRLEDAVLIEIEADRTLLDPLVPPVEGHDPRDYESALYYGMEDDTEEKWTPERIILLD